MQTHLKKSYFLWYGFVEKWWAVNILSVIGNYEQIPFYPYHFMIF